MPAPTPAQDLARDFTKHHINCPTCSKFTLRQTAEGKGTCRRGLWIAAKASMAFKKQLRPRLDLKDLF